MLGFQGVLWHSPSGTVWSSGVLWPKSGRVPGCATGRIVAPARMFTSRCLQAVTIKRGNSIHIPITRVDPLSESLHVEDGVAEEFRAMPHLLAWEVEEGGTSREASRS